MALARPEDRSQLELLFRTGVEAVDAGTSTARFLKTDSGFLEIGGFKISRPNLKKIWILGGGKATAAMAKVAEEFFLEEMPQAFAGGVIVVKEGHGLPLEHVRCREASHPVPNSQGEKGAIELLKQVAGTEPDDLILFLLSGGASALLPLPAKGIPLASKMSMTRTLLECGADIHEINALRKHCSRIKGGKLVRAAPGAVWVTLAISDVPGDSPETIGSGPTVGDPTTLNDCWSIVRKYGIERKLSPEILEHLQRESSETPKPGDELFSRTYYQVMARNKDAVNAAVKKAIGLNYPTVPESRFLSDDISQVTEFWKKLKERCDREMKKPFAAIVGGEPTVEVKGPGKGGRNMELALRLAGMLPGKFSFLSAGTDGTDGPTDAAGAFVDETTIPRARKMGMEWHEYLERNDSYPFFEKIGDLFVTGPTGTNVMDLQMLLVRQ
ncbi:MAG: glycerate kinase [Candidatus Neomarinimicrobiota bacterium]